MTVCPQRLIEIARGIAPLLDGNWKVDERVNVPSKRIWGFCVEIFNCENPNMRFSLSAAPEYSNRNKAYVRGNFKCFSKHLTCRGTHSIMFNPARKVPSIATDINNRFLAIFNAEFSSHSEEFDKYSNQAERFSCLVNMMKGMIPSLKKSCNSKSYTYGKFNAREFGLEFTIYDDQVSISGMRLELDQFIKLMHYLKSEFNEN